MRFRISRFLPLFLVVMFILVMCVNPISAIRTRSGSGNLSPDQVRESTINGYLNGQIEGTVTGTEGPLDIYIIHIDDYVDVSSINTLDCIVYEHDTFLEFSFSVLTDGDWVLILRNPNSFNVNFEFSWTSTEPEAMPIVAVAPMVFPSFLFLIALGYIITVQKGVHPEARIEEEKSSSSAIIGFVSILLATVLPASLQLNITSSQGNMLLSLLWTQTSSGYTLHFLSTANPYAWIMPMLLIGPTYLFPFALMHYYQGKTTKRRLIKMGIISIIPILVFTGLGLLTLLLSPSYPLILIPLPLVFILGLIVSKYIPAPRAIGSVSDL